MPPGVIASEAKQSKRPRRRSAPRNDMTGRNDNPWSAAATWTCCGVYLAAGLTPCVIYAVATLRWGWAFVLSLALLTAAAVPVYLTLFAGRKNLRLYAGSVFTLSGLWVLLWSLLPDVENYVRDGLLGTGGFLILLGLLFLVLYLAEGHPPRDEAGEAPGG